jgi:hypothetical protein
MEDTIRFFPTVVLFSSNINQAMQVVTWKRNVLSSLELPLLIPLKYSGASNFTFGTTKRTYPLTGLEFVCDVCQRGW